MEWLTLSEGEIAREKNRATELKRTQWWKNQKGRGRCHYCEGEFLPVQLTMDHIVPLARGGKTTKGNVVPCCKDCNNSKKYMLPLEWQEYLDTL